MNEETENQTSDDKLYQKLIKQANEASERLEAANAKHEELLERKAKMELENVFDGKTETSTKKAEETAAEYKDKIMRGEL